LKGHCLAVGRDESEIKKTWSPDVFIRRTEKELKAEGSLSLRGDAFDAWQNTNLVGTVEQVSEKVQKYIGLGCSGFIPWCADYPSTETVELFAEVMSNFR
jgi:alkanesulfonate monooxygenase SsuD/methylene tetrahydromethanopterin reductase-like flavin-dependent oxidoreductase (luciferase family)